LAQASRPLFTSAPFRESWLTQSLSGSPPLLYCFAVHTIVGGFPVILDKKTHDILGNDNPMLAPTPLLPSILSRMELVVLLGYTTLVKLSIPWNRWSACTYAFASLGAAAPVPTSLFLLTNRRPPRIMIRSSTPRITRECDHHADHPAYPPQ
jgi:hypothetical protein